jgi:hypothetical protein
MEAASEELRDRVQRHVDPRGHADGRASGDHIVDRYRHVWERTRRDHPASSDGAVLDVPVRRRIGEHQHLVLREVDHPDLGDPGQGVARDLATEVELHRRIRHLDDEEEIPVSAIR